MYEKQNEKKKEIEFALESNAYRYDAKLTTVSTLLFYFIFFFCAWLGIKSAFLCVVFLLFFLFLLCILCSNQPSVSYKPECKRRKKKKKTKQHENSPDFLKINNNKKHIAYIYRDPVE